MTAAARVVLAALVSASAALTGCAASASGASPHAVSPPAAVQPVADLKTPTSAHVTKVLVVVLENSSRRHATVGLPHLTSLAGQYGTATNYRAASHPSLPNYLALAGGSTFGVGDDAGPSAHPVHGASVFDQAIAAGRTAKTYAESMPSPCALAPSGRYAVKHNPWVYFSDPASRAACRRGDVPAGTTRAGALHDDIARGTLPDVGLIVPDLCDDAHDCPLPVADHWLAGWLDAVRQGLDWRSGRLAVVVTFDEDDHSQGNQVLTAVLAPVLHHRTATVALDHYSTTRWWDTVIAARPLRSAAGARSLGAAFGL